MNGMHHRPERRLPRHQLLRRGVRARHVEDHVEIRGRLRRWSNG
jgi:hypothetical protein